MTNSFPVKADRYALALASLSGCALHLYTAAFRAEGAVDLFLVGLVAWSCSPYAAAVLVARWTADAWVPLGFVVGALAGDLFMHYSVFIAPKGSTAALGLLFMPLWNLLLSGPLGALAGWGIRFVLRFRGRRTG